MSCAMRGWKQVVVPSLSQHLENLRAQLGAVTIPLSQQVKETLQTLQQTAGTAGCEMLQLRNV